MIQALSVPKRSPKQFKSQIVRLSGVAWQDYLRLVRAFDERHDVRLTYDRGELEIISPKLNQLGGGRFLGTQVFVLTDELGLPLKRGGSTTMRSRLKQRGIESDECFWIANALRMAGRRDLNLDRDPPPDLAIEVDVANSSLDRLTIYAALCVPEVWRLEGKILIFYLLGDDGTYKIVSHSLTFPKVTPADILGFLEEAREAGDENVVIRRFRKWIRKRHAKSGRRSKPS